MIYCVLFLAALCAWCISTLAAGGAALIFISLCSIILPASLIVPVSAVAGLLSAVHRAFLYRRDVNWDVCAWVLPGVVSGALTGAMVYSWVNPAAVGAITGLFLIILGSAPFFKFQFFTHTPRVMWFLPAGFFTSMISALTGASGPMLNALYLRCRVPRLQILGTKSLTILIMQGVKVSSYIALSTSTHEFLLLGVVAGAGGMVGNLIGRITLDRMGEKDFSTAVHLLILVCGVLLLRNVLPR